MTVGIVAYNHYSYIHQQECNVISLKCYDTDV